VELRPDLWHCADCETAYAVGLSCCPQCSSTRRADAAAEGLAIVGEHGPETVLLPKTAEPEEM